MKIGITGSTGVLGTNLKKILVNHNLISYRQRIENIKNLERWIKKSDLDAIIHLAAIVPTKKVNQNKIKSLKTNFIGTKNIVDTINKYSKKKIWMFYASTSHVYSHKSKIITETDETKPINFYGKTKLLGEKYILKNIKNYTPCIGRIFSYTSKKQNKSFVIPSILSKFKNKDNKIYFKNFNHERDFVKLNDICKAIKILLKNNSKGVFNICSNKKNNLQDLILKLNKKYQKKIIFNSNQKKTIIYGSNKKLLKLGWKPNKTNYYDYLLKNY